MGFLTDMLKKKTQPDKKWVKGAELDGIEAEEGEQKGLMKIKGRQEENTEDEKHEKSKETEEEVKLVFDVETNKQICTGLGKLGHPITLFGETPEQRYERLVLIETSDDKEWKKPEDPNITFGNDTANVDIKQFIDDLSLKIASKDPIDLEFGTEEIELK